MSRLAGVVGVLANGQERAEPANLLVYVPYLLGAFVRVADDPQVLHHVIHVHHVIGHVRVDLGALQIVRGLPVWELMLRMAPSLQKNESTTRCAWIFLALLVQFIGPAKGKIGLSLA